MLDVLIHGIAQISGKAGGCLGGVFAGQNAQRQRDHSHQKGEQAVLEDGVHIERQRAVSGLRRVYTRPDVTLTF